jgi:hypothetical protein
MSTKEYVSSYVKRAKAAQQQIQSYTQEQIDEVCVAIGWEVYNDQNIEISQKWRLKKPKWEMYRTKSPNTKIKCSVF